MARVWLWGDSISQGVVYDAQQEKYRLEKQAFARVLPEKLGIALCNKSAMGATIARGETLLARENVLPGDVVILEYGGNDCDFDWARIADDPQADHVCNTPPDSFRARLEALVRALRAKGAHPMLMTLPPLNAQRYFDFVRRGLDGEAILAFLGDVQQIYRWQELYSCIIANIGARLRCPVLDARAQLLAYRGGGDLHCADGIHLSAYGHTLLCDAMMRQPCLSFAARVFRPRETAVV